MDDSLINWALHHWDGNDRWDERRKYAMEKYGKENYDESWYVRKIRSIYEGYAKIPMANHDERREFMIRTIQRENPDYLIMTCFSLDPGEFKDGEMISTLDRLPDGFIYGSSHDPKLDHPTSASNNLHYVEDIEGYRFLRLFSAFLENSMCMSVGIRDPCRNLDSLMEYIERKQIECWGDSGSDPIPITIEMHTFGGKKIMYMWFSS